MRVLGVFVSILLTACTHHGTLQSPTPAGLAAAEQPRIAGAVFTLQALRWQGKRIDLPATRRPTIQFDDSGKISGLAGVNRFTGEAVFTGNHSFALRGPIALTKMAGPPEAMALEESFLQALQSVTRMEMVSGTLRLTSADGAVSLELGR